MGEINPISNNYTSKESSLHPLGDNKLPAGSIFKKTIVIALIVALGVTTGYFANKIGKNGNIPSGISKEGHMVIKNNNSIGSTDTQTFRDKAEGMLEKGGIDGEGTHKLIRDKKRPDQNVYLTSSVLNLDDYVGKKVRVWGETNAGQKAGWLMDVGKVEVL